MKLRIQDDSLRLRLTRGEVDDLSRGLAVERTARFPGGRALQYVVTGSASADWRFGQARLEANVGGPR